MTPRKSYSLTFRNLLTFEINFRKGGHHAVRAEGTLLQLLGPQGRAPAPQGDTQGLEAHHYPQSPPPQGAGEGALTSPLTAVLCAGPSAVPSSIPDLRMLGGNLWAQRRRFKDNLVTVNFCFIEFDIELCPWSLLLFNFVIVRLILIASNI